MAVKVMITDDHSLIREGLKQLLELCLENRVLPGVQRSLSINH